MQIPPKDRFDLQRRNFLIVSSSLLFLAMADVRLERLGFWDQALAAQDAWVVYAAVWVVCLYCCYGFVVQFLADRGAALAESVGDTKRASVRQYLHDLGEKSGPAARHTEPPDDISVWPMDIEVEIFKHFEADNPDGAGRGRPWQASIEQGFVRINRAVWAFLVLRGLLMRFLLGREFFDYLLPVLWFLVAVGVAASGDWPGAPGAILKAARGEGSAALGAVTTFQQTVCDWPSLPTMR